MDSLPTESILLRIEKPAFIPVAVISGIGMVMTSLFVAVNIRYRGYKLLKMTSPNLNLVMLAGAFVLFAAVVLLGATAWLPENPQTSTLHLIWKFNYAGIWLASVGFTLFFAPLAAKTWRVHRIFTDAAVKGRVIKDDKLLCFVALLVLFDLGFLSLWFGLDPPQCHLLPSSHVPGFLSTTLAKIDTTSTPKPTSEPVTSVMTQEYITVCTSSFSPLWIFLLSTYKSLLLYYIIYVAWSTRYVTLPSMKDAGGLIISIFVTLTSFCVATPLVTSLYRWPNAQYLVMSSAFFVSLFTVMFLHFVPKVILIRRHNKDEILTRSFSQYATPNKPEFTEDEIRDLAIQNASLRKEVSEKQRRYKTVLEQLRVAKAKLFEYSMMTSDSAEILAPMAASDDVTSRTMPTESSPMTSTEIESMKNADKTITKKESKSTKKKFRKNKENNLKDTGESVTTQKLDDVTTSASSSNSPPVVDDEISSIANESEQNDTVGNEITSPISERHQADENDYQDDNDVNYSKKHLRHVSFTDLPPRRDRRVQSTSSYNSQYKSQPALSHNHRHEFPSLGKNSWDYYTRGTGFLKYKATVLNHGVNGTIAAITGYPVTGPNPNRIVARRNVVNDEVSVKSSALVHSTPVLTEASGNEDEIIGTHGMNDLNKENLEKKKKEFRYYSTSASSRSPSTSTDMTSSALGHSNDDTNTSNNNIHPIDTNKEKISKRCNLSSNDTDVPSANSAFSVVKGKRPCSGFNDVIVTSPPNLRKHPEYMYNDYSSDSDSDDYDDTTTSMDSITCELFPPLTPRHKHYLRRYDAMQAKYLAHREKSKRRIHKSKHSEKSEGYSSGNDDKQKELNNGNDVMKLKEMTSLRVAKSNGHFYAKDLRRKVITRACRRADDAFLYDSITSSDSDSDSDWSNSDTLQRCWQKVAEQGRLPLLQAGPITYSHTHKDGIFV